MSARFSELTLSSAHAFLRARLKAYERFQRLAAHYILKSFFLHSKRKKPMIFLILLKLFLSL
jgi:hypothetical protein